MHAKCGNDLTPLPLIRIKPPWWISYELCTDRSHESCSFPIPKLPSEGEMDLTTHPSQAAIPQRRSRQNKVLGGYSLNL